MESGIKKTLRQGRFYLVDLRMGDGDFAKFATQILHVLQWRRSRCPFDKKRERTILGQAAIFAIGNLPVQLASLHRNGLPRPVRHVAEGLVYILAAQNPGTEPWRLDGFG